MSLWDHLPLRRALLTAICCAAAVYAGVQIPENPLFPVLVLGATAYVITLGANYEWMFWLVIATFSSAIIVPGLPGRPFLWEAASLAAWPSLMVYGAVGRDRLARVRVPQEAVRAAGCLFAYGLVLVLLMIVRGVGFRAFGGQQMGGRFYVQQLVLSVVPLVAVLVPWTERRLLSAFFASVALSTTYLVSDFALLRGGSVAEVLLRFLEVPTDAFNFYVGYELTGLRRFQSFATVGDALLMAFLACVPLRTLFGRLSMMLLPVLGCILALGFASGHRTILLIALGTTVLLGGFQRLYTPRRVLVIVLALAAGLAALYQIADRLPLGMQRAVSVLPGIEVSPLAASDAENTVRDRLEALKLGLPDVGSYLWVGRGFGLDRLDKRQAGALDDRVRTAYESGYFDNGALGLLIKTGLVGLLAACGYMFFICRAALRCVRLSHVRSLEEQDIFDRYSQLVAAKWFAVALFFLFVRGDASTFMPAVAVPSALVLLCLRLQEKRADSQGDEGAD